MLIVVKHGNIEQLFQSLFDDETVRRFDVFQVDAAKRRSQIAHRVDERFDVLRIDEEIDRVDVGEALEQCRLAFHNRLCGQRTKIAKAKDGRSV